jgi:acyl carrier protein
MSMTAAASGIDQARERVRALMEKNLRMSLSPDKDADELHIDSMALLELVVGIEKEFGIRLNEEELDSPEHFRSVESISRFVMQSLPGGK